MNCKKGDLAIVVAGNRTEYLGMSVTCLHLVDNNIYRIPIEVGPVWEVDKTFSWHTQIGLFIVDISKPWMPDKLLRPITPDAGMKRDEAERDITGKLKIDSSELALIEGGWWR